MFDWTNAEETPPPLTGYCVLKVKELPMPLLGYYDHSYGEHGWMVSDYSYGRELEFMPMPHYYEVTHYVPLGGLF